MPVIRSFLLILIVLAPLVVDAQSFYRRRSNRYIVVSAGTGTASYYGELRNPGSAFQAPKLNLEFGLEYKFHPRFSAKSMLTMFQLKGDDRKADNPERERRNLRFVSDNIELAFVGRAQLFEDAPRYYQRRAWNGYAFLGFGFLWYNPKADLPATDWSGNPVPNAGSNVGLRQYQTEGIAYGNVGLVVPVGLGMIFRVNPWFNIAVDGGYRFTFTDYLDDISTTHPGVSAFSDPVAAALSDRRNELDLPAAPAGTKRGSPNANDGYFILNIKVEYYLQSLFGYQTGVVHKKTAKHR